MSTHLSISSQDSFLGIRHTYDTYQTVQCQSVPFSFFWAKLFRFSLTIIFCLFSPGDSLEIVLREQTSFSARSTETHCFQEEHIH